MLPDNQTRNVRFRDDGAMVPLAEGQVLEVALPVYDSRDFQGYLSGLTAFAVHPNS